MSSLADSSLTTAVLMGNTHTYFFRRPPFPLSVDSLRSSKVRGSMRSVSTNSGDAGTAPRTTPTRNSSNDLSLRYVRDFFAKHRRPDWNQGKKSGAAEAGASYLIRTSRNFRNNEEDLGRNEVDSTDMETFVFGRALLLRTS